MNSLRSLALATALSALILPVRAADWDDIPTQQAPPAQPVRQAEPVESSPIPLVNPQQFSGLPKQLPNVNALLQASKQHFDPQHETPEQYLTRMKALEHQFEILQDANEQARLDPATPKLPPGMVLPGMSSYQAGHDFAGSPYDKGFFNGLTPEQAAAGLQMEVEPRRKLNQSPEWAKQKVPMRHFVDGVEHFGKEDEMGFLD